MRTRCYSICRKCAAVYPEGRRCPTCDGDAQAAREVAEARSHAVEASRPQRPPMLRTTLLVSSVLAASLIAAFGMVALALI